MKTLRKITLMMLAMTFAIQVTLAQDNKAPKVDSSGKITDKDGKYIGNVTEAGVISDPAGTKVAFVNADGVLVDAISGQNLGSVEKDGTFVPSASIDRWSLSPLKDGSYLVLDTEGNIKAQVYETYKHAGAGAVHCLDQGKKTGTVLEETKDGVASYACSVHPDITSDKPGKCKICGMELVRKAK